GPTMNTRGDRLAGLGPNQYASHARIGQGTPRIPRRGDRTRHRVVFDRACHVSSGPPQAYTGSRRTGSPRAPTIRAFTVGAVIPPAQPPCRGSRTVTAGSELHRSRARECATRIDEYSARLFCPVETVRPRPSALDRRLNAVPRP